MNDIRKLIYIACGTICVALGVIGIFVPLLPTTGPLLLAAFFYSRSSPRFYHWLLHNRWFGSYIKNYREGRGMPMRSKIITLATLWLTIGISIVLVALWWVKLLLLVIALGVTIHIVMLKTFRPASAPASERNSELPQ
jgi:uncharacterized membrane protein YbaN (DUF454 family)